MSTLDDLLRSRRLSPHFKLALLDLDSATDPDLPVFKSALVSCGQAPASIAGVGSLVQLTQGIFSAEDISINGLKNLVDHPGVVQVEISRPMFPET